MKRKKIIISITLLLLILAITRITFAQGMMGGFNSTATPDEVTQTTQDEAAGKAIWDKLQNKEVICKDLKDDDFDVLGDFFMGNSIGSNHASMNLIMKQRMGDDGEKQMHIAIGKRLSGCDTNVSFPEGSSYFLPMMGGLGGMMGGWNQNNSTEGRGFSTMGYGVNGNGQNGWGIFETITWLLLLAFLILGIFYFWNGIKRNK